MNVRKASSPPRGRLERFLSSVEDGKFFIPVQASVVALAVLAAVLAGIDVSSGTDAEPAQRAKVYAIKRVSTIPLEQRDMAAESSVEERKDDGMTADEIRRRYVNYVIARIEQNKIYPVSEQKLGHEGSVSIRLYMEKGGGVRRAVILRQARYAKLTESAIASIRNSIPFMPFPRGIPDDEIILNLNMEYYLK